MAKVILIVALFLGCDNSGDAKLAEVTKSFNDLAGQARDTVSRITPSKEQALEELNKLYSVEYKIHDISKSLSGEELEAELNLLGQERWDCFKILTEGSYYRFICKRTPKSYLRHLGNLSGFVF